MREPDCAEGPIRLRRDAGIACDQGRHAATPHNGLVRKRRTRMNASILVPFDGSPSAERALEHAIDLVKAEPATVHVVNVEPFLDDYGMVPVYLSRRKHHAITEERGEALLAPALERLEKEHVPHQGHVVW